MESLASGKSKAVEVYSASDVLPGFYEEQSKNLINLIKAYYRHLNQKFGPSYEISNLINFHDIDTSSDRYLDAIQRVIASNIPQAAVLDRKRVFKLIANYYNNRGSEESIYTFFKIFYNEVITLIYPKNDLLHTSNDKAVLSDRFRLRDSYKWQEFSYLISSEKDSAEWKNEYLKFVHPAGLKFFTALTIASVEDDINIKPMWDDGCGGFKSYLHSIPDDPCDFWEYIDWQKYFGRHSPRFQSCADPNLVYLFLVLYQHKEHYLTLLRNPFNIPCPKEVLRAVYPSYSFALLITNSPNNGLLKRWDDIWRINGKFIDSGYYLDGYANYTIEETEREFCLGRSKRILEENELTNRQTAIYSINCAHDINENTGFFKSFTPDTIPYLSEGPGEPLTGINVYDTTNSITFHSSVPVGTPEQLFQSEFFDADFEGAPLKFVFPVYDSYPDGEITYEVRLFFAEIFPNEGDTRIFDVYINDNLVLNNYNIKADAGGNYLGIMKTFYVSSVNGEISIFLDHIFGGENPKISGIQILGPYIANEKTIIPNARFGGFSTYSSIDTFTRSYTCEHDENYTLVNSDNQWIDLTPEDGVSNGLDVYAFYIGDGSNSQLPLEHNLGTKNLIFGVREVATGDLINVSALAFNDNILLFDFNGIVPDINEYYVYIQSEPDDSPPTGNFYSETWVATQETLQVDITHNLSTQNIIYSIIDIDGNFIFVNASTPDNNTLRLSFNDPPNHLSSPPEQYTIFIMSANDIDAYSEIIGDGSTTEFNINHSLNSQNILYSVREISTGEFVEVSAEVITDNTLKLFFNEPPTSNQFEIYIKTVIYDPSQFVASGSGLLEYDPLMSPPEIYSQNIDYSNSLVYYEKGQSGLKTICWVATLDNSS